MHSTQEMVLTGNEVALFARYLIDCGDFPQLEQRTNISLRASEFLQFRMPQIYTEHNRSWRMPTNPETYKAMGVVL